jgi:hypothetical protein
MIALRFVVRAAIYCKMVESQELRGRMMLTETKDQNNRVEGGRRVWRKVGGSTDVED